MRRHCRACEEEGLGPRCPRCGCCEDCCECEEDLDLFDADELGLDPEEDDLRAYETGTMALLKELNVNLTLLRASLF